MGIAFVVLRPRGGDMSDKLLPIPPRPSLQVVVAEGVIEGRNSVSVRFPKAEN